jgi:uncharacterized membrane protein
MSVVIFALLGGVVGGALLSELGGFVFGAIVGGLLGSVADLAGRVRQLERRLDARRTAEAEGAPPEAGRRVAAAPQREPAAEPHGVEQHPMPPRAAAPGSRPAPGPTASAAAASPRRDGAAAGRAPLAAARRERKPSQLEKWLHNAASWFTTGNVPVKVGVVLSLFGVGFLVKEGIDRQWLVLPLELKLVLVALFGIALLLLGWRLRARQRIYALSVQGGGIGVLYLTIYASYAVYDLLPAALAFGLLVAITAGAGVLAVLQDARSLAVLGTLGGFLAPVLTSSDSGNHVALFSYYAVLDLAILGVAWFRPGAC